MPGAPHRHIAEDSHTLHEPAPAIHPSAASPRSSAIDRGRELVVVLATVPTADNVHATGVKRTLSQRPTQHDRKKLHVLRRVARHASCAFRVDRDVRVLDVCHQKGPRRCVRVLATS